MHRDNELVDLLLSEDEAREARRASLDWPSWELTPRQMCDLELLLDGSFSPLPGFMGHADFVGVCDRMRLVDGTLWPLPITLDVTDRVADRLSIGDRLALRDPGGVMLAVLRVDSLFAIDREAKARAVYGTLDRRHPGVEHLFSRSNNVAVGGAIEGIELPTHFAFTDLRLRPVDVRRRFSRRGWDKVVAFQTRNPMHRAHFELTLRAVEDLGARLLIHPVVGMTKPGDVDQYTRVRCYRAMLKRYPADTAMLALLPLAMRMGGPRETLLHAIVRRNYGCTHLVVGRDHAGPGNDSSGQPFYGPYEAQQLMRRHEAEIGIGMVACPLMVYAEQQDEYLPADQVPDGARTLSISGTELRERLARGDELPSWFTYPEVAEELKRTHKPRSEQGFTIFFTGLSGAGKSTIANVLRVKLLEHGGRAVTLLDGDLVRKVLSSELGFSKAHRDLNIRRIGSVADAVTRSGGIAICAQIAPYEAVRRRVREEIEGGGGFVLVHLSTPIEVCERRDRKGLYAKARAGLVKGFTGVSDPYEPPESPDIVLDTSGVTPLEGAHRILRFLDSEGYIDMEV
ncbi:MAG: bifunctional sulfate adenylyltransferase/adenylylsulfate kinase [Acidobacteriota bacterium]